MIKKPYILLILYFYCLFPAFSQNNGYRIGGTVIDKITKDTLTGANIAVLGLPRGAVSGENGKFELVMPPGNYSIIITYLGYNNDTVLINLVKDIELKIELSQKAVEGKEVIFVGNINKNVDDVNTGVIELKEEQLKNLPALLGEADPVRIIQLTPGVQSAKEGFGGLYVRG